MNQLYINRKIENFRGEQDEFRGLIQRSIPSPASTSPVLKNCWIEIFDDDEYDDDDSHVKIQGSAVYATLKDVNGRNWRQ